MLSSEFNWDKYLKTCEAKAAPENLFKPVSLSFKANVAVSFNVSQMLKSLLRNDDAEPEWNRFPHPSTPSLDQNFHFFSSLSLVFICPRG